MRCYFHNFPTCPSCHTPHEFSSVRNVDPEDLCENCSEIKGFCHTHNCDVYLMKNDENYDLHPVYKCMNCEAYFKSNIDFSKYPKALSVFQDHTNSTSDSIPLYWNIKLNEIEQSYLEWLDFKDDSIYWITWPWDEVKFMPILIAEYALKFPNKKIVVVSNFHDEDVENEFYKPNLYETFDYLYSGDFQENFFNEFKKEMGKFNPKKEIIKKSKKVHFHLIPLKSNLTPHDITKDYSVYNFKLTHAKVCNIINEQLGNKFVKSVNLYDSKKNCRNVNKEYYEVSVDVNDNMDWGVRRLLFDKLGYFNILYNFDSVHKLSDDLNYTEIFDEDLDLNNQVFFIDSNNEKLFNHIHKINPDMVIFTDADKFFTDYRSNYWIKRQRGEKFINLLKNNEFCTILFSTERSVRFIFKQLDENNLFDSTILYKHTWDSSEVLERIDNNQSFNFILSSSLDDFEYREEPNVEYCNVQSMELIEKHIDGIFAKIKTNQNLYFPFFRTLKTTPLPLLEDGKYPTFVYNDYSLKRIMDNLCETINGNMDENDFYDELMEPFNKIYHDDSMRLYNPLRFKIEEIINQYIDENCKIKVISYNLQKKQLKNVLNIDQYGGKVDVVTWMDLANLDQTEERIIVISTLYPFMDYDIYDEKIYKYIFIGGPNYIEYMKNIIDKRVLEKEARPLEIIDDNAPNLLIDTLSDIPDSSSEIKDIIQEITIDLNSTINFAKRPKDDDGNPDNSSNFLEKGSPAILFIDENQHAMFFPVSHVINYKSGNEFSEYDLSEGRLKNLVGKRLCE